jgi:hypothetical protein
MNTGSLIRRVIVGVGVIMLVASMSLDAAAGASGTSRVRPGKATQLTAAGWKVVVDDATADLRQRLRGNAQLDELADSVRFDGSQELSALALADEPGAVRITPRATTEAPSRQAVGIAIAEPDLTVWTMGGGRKDTRYPPEAFAVTPHPLDTHGPRSGPVEFGSTSGRSSRSVLPLFLVTDRSASRGYWFAIGWSGS